MKLFNMQNIVFLSFLFAAISLSSVSFGEDLKKDSADGDFENTVEKTKGVDSGDIAVKVAQKSGGAVWGKAKAENAESSNAASSNTVSNAASNTASSNTVSSNAVSNTASKDTKETKKAEKPTEKSAGKPTEKLTGKPAEKTSVNRPVIKPEERAAIIKTEEKVPEGVSPPTQTPVLLRSSRKSGTSDLVETLLEVSGEVKQVDNEMKSVSDKMEVVAGFRYEERIDKYPGGNSSGANPLVSVRQYNLAKAKMKIGKNLKTPQLDEEMRTIVCSLDQGKVTLFSPKGQLRGEELLLVEDLPGNTLTLDRLLPGREVKVGESWKIDAAVLKSFLSLDAVTEHNVEAVLTAVADNMAMVEMVGDVHGIYIGAPTEMTVRAKYQFDLKMERINWLGLLIEESRSIGHVSPGFELVARLQVKVSPCETPETLTDEVMKTIDKEPSRKVLELKYDAVRAPWHFLHSRDWYVYQDDAQTTILRKVHKGELVAQCNVADMGKVDVKTMTTLDKFQRELAEGLGASFDKIVSAAESKSKQGDKVYRVLIDGHVEDLKLRWIYNLITAPDGRQSVVVFVVESAMLEQFANADEILLDTYKMVE